MNTTLGISHTKKVLVVGDAMLDKYTFGSVERISPEAPVPILKVEKNETRLGGAANVAANLAAVGVRVTLLSISGDDLEADILLNEIKNANVDPQLLRSSNISTIVKKRLLAQQQQLIRIDDEHEQDVKAAYDLYKKFLDIFLDYDLVVLSDYGKGALIDHQSYIENCNKSNIDILVDPKGGNFNHYANSTIITPNLREFEEIVGSSSSNEEFLSKAIELKNKLNLSYLIVTLGADGVFVLDKKNSPHRMQSEAKQVFDVSGAGDTVIAILAALIASGYEVTEALDIANIAAGLAVAKVGTSVVTYQEILNAIKNKEKVNQPIYDIDELLQVIKVNKKDKKKIVMTNGCFDILHAGHVTYLEEAAKLGDILILAINTDSSVKRLKGSSRPINSLKSRAKVLSGLRSVDYIVSFDDDTPEELYEYFLPDILVKGSDYKNTKIIGADAVIKNGGSVVLIDFLDGHSTTETIKKIKQ